MEAFDSVARARMRKWLPRKRAVRAEGKRRTTLGRLPSDGSRTTPASRLICSRSLSSVTYGGGAGYFPRPTTEPSAQELRRSRRLAGLSPVCPVMAPDQDAPTGCASASPVPFQHYREPRTFSAKAEQDVEEWLTHYGLKWEICMCYLDDVVIFGRTFSEHNKRLDLVQNCLGKAGLVLKAKNCHFSERQTLVLGHLVDKEGIGPDPQKTAAVEAFKAPQSVMQLRSFLGLCSYFRLFIPRFADLAHPLTRLLHKGVPFEWNPECDSSFRRLKFLLTSKPILRHFDPSSPSEVHTGASGVGIGAVLVQRVGDNEHVISYASRSLSRCERNYTVTEQECLAVIFAVQWFRSYLYEHLFTDHHRSSPIIIHYAG